MGVKLDPGIVTAVALAALVAGWMATGTVVVSGAADSADALPPPAVRNAEAEGEAFAVRVRRVEPVERARTLELRGRTAAEAKVAVAAETAARVEERPVDRGEEVAAGDVLCRLDPGVRQAELAEAEAEAARARLEHEAATRLAGKGFESATRVAATKAALDAALARVAAAELELERTVVRAPIGGIVDKPLAEVGDRLSVGEVCATIVDIDPLVVTGQVSEREVAAVRQGVAAPVTLVSGETATGTVTYVSRTADPDTRTFTVEIDVPNPDGRLREGVTARAALPLPPVEAYRLEPSWLTLADDGRIGVRTVDESARVGFAPVEIVGQDRDGVWATGPGGPLAVISVGQDYVVEGERVRPVPAEGENLPDLPGGNS